MSRDEQPVLNGELKVAVEVLRADIQNLEKIVKMYMSDHRTVHLRIDKDMDDHESRIRENNEKLSNQRGFMIWATAFIGLIFTAVNIVISLAARAH